MAYDPIRNQFIFFGGQPYAGGVSNQTWAWQSGQWTQMSPATSPAGRLGEGMAWDPALNEIVMFGGTTTTSTFNDLWAWTGTNWVALPDSAPPTTRSGFGFAWDPASGANGLVVFGGLHDTSTGGVYLNDTWLYSNGTWRQLQANGAAGAPAARAGMGMAYSTSTSQLVMYGGLEASGAGGVDTWIFGGSSWSQQTSASAPPAGTPVMVYDPGMGAIILADTQDGSLQDTWAWNGATWLQAPAGIVAPADIGTGEMAADNSGHLLAAAGTTGDGTQATYLYDSSLPIVSIALTSTANGKGGPTGPNGIYYTGDTLVAQITAANPGVITDTGFNITSDLTLGGTRGILASGSLLAWAGGPLLCGTIQCASGVSPTSPSSSQSISEIAWSPRLVRSRCAAGPASMTSPYAAVRKWSRSSAVVAAR